VTGFDLEARSRSRGEGEIAWWRRDRAVLESIFAWSALVWIGAGVARCDETDAIWCDRRSAAIDETNGVWVVGLELDLWSSNWSSVWGVIWALSLSLYAWVRKWFEVKIWIETNFRVKPTKTHGQLKITTSGIFIFAQLNTCIYRKAFSKVIWSQNKHNLSSSTKLMDLTWIFFRDHCKSKKGVTFG